MKMKLMHNIFFPKTNFIIDNLVDNVCETTQRDKRIFIIYYSAMKHIQDYFV